LPISFFPCIGKMVDRLPSRTLKWLPLAGENEHPCCSSHLMNSLLVTVLEYNRDVSFSTHLLRWARKFAEAKGFGFTEAPRGALGHWVHIKDRKIANYQIVVPSTWNASPKDGKGQHGAYEAALLNTPMADPQRPIEILRTIHSFDPCLACASHVIGPDGRKLAEVVVR
jgi:Ni,Fe-hydrogenase I large subunit